MQVTELERIFKFKDAVLTDPSPEMTTEEVLAYYSNMYPELTTSSIHCEFSETGQMEYVFKTTIGTKG